MKRCNGISTYMRDVIAGLFFTATLLVAAHTPRRRVASGTITAGLQRQVAIDELRYPHQWIRDSRAS